LKRAGLSPLRREKPRYVKHFGVVEMRHAYRYKAS